MKSRTAPIHAFRRLALLCMASMLPLPVLAQQPYLYPSPYSAQYSAQYSPQHSPQYSPTSTPKPIAPTEDGPNPYLIFSRPPVKVAPVPTPVILLPAIPVVPAWQLPSFAPAQETKPAPAPQVKAPLVVLPTLPALPTWQMPQLIPAAAEEKPKAAQAPTPPPAPTPAPTPPPASVPSPQPKAGFFELPALPTMPDWQMHALFPPAEAKPAPAPKPEKSAANPNERTLADLGESLRSYFTDEEVDLLVEYMKESVIATFKGEEVYLPPDLAFKLEVLLVRLQKEGGLYMDNLIKQMERDLKNSLKKKPEPKAAPQSLPTTTPASNSGAPTTKGKSKADNSISATIDEWLKSLKPR